ncbi:hypothetical protein Vadar_030832 [Vaccinium darrowii]|uniref:Uncharacterized protein n=1 Tax=Vaccinium darrowii TaxID=229202 RepID=A0ACB7ZMP0_9ERIC|nr:hypothetical protein Vadar_030832 [Vaccinium darrowii]
MMVAAVSGAAASTTDPQNPKINSHQNDAQQQQNPNKRPPFKSRQVSSRYMSPSSSSTTSTSAASSISSISTPTRRCPSPLVSRNSNPLTNTPIPAPKRAVSADRRRPTPSRPLTPGFESRLSNAGEVSAATKLLVTSTRSLSVSFQGEAFSLPISKTKAAPPASNVRKGTPERRSVSTSTRSSTPVRGKVDGGGDQVESLSKSIDQHRWPGRTRQQQQPNSISRSLDCSEDKMKLIGSGNGNNVVRALQKSMIFDDSRRASFDGRLGLDLGGAELLRAIQKGPNGNSVNDQSSVISDLAASDSDRDSVSSGSTSGVQECGGGGSMKGRNGPRGIAVSARFWQETNSRLRRLNDPGSTLSSTSPAKMVVPPKFGQSKKFPSDSTLSSPRTMSSPIRGGGIRPASPSKSMTSMVPSPVRGMISPSRVRSSVSGTISSSFGETPSVLSFAVDVRRGKVGENRLGDAHLLRLLYNRHLQWRFVNARTEAALLVQRNSAEKNLWNAWITTSELRDSVTKKRHRLQLLKQKLKLASILKGEVTGLEKWACLDKDHSVSLLGAIEALKASTLRLPVVGGAIADVQSVKDAIGSAVDVMQAMSYSMFSLLTKVEEVNSLVAELVKVISKERALLEQCKDFLSMLAAMQVKYFSLRTQILQLTRVPTA